MKTYCVIITGEHSMLLELSWFIFVESALRNRSTLRGQSIFPYNEIKNFLKSFILKKICKTWWSYHESWHYHDYVFRHDHGMIMICCSCFSTPGTFLYIFLQGSRDSKTKSCPTTQDIFCHRVSILTQKIQSCIFYFASQDALVKYSTP